jgi:hypothetical protein
LTDAEIEHAIRRPRKHDGWNKTESFNGYHGWRVKRTKWNGGPSHYAFTSCDSSTTLDANPGVEAEVKELLQELYDKCFQIEIHRDMSRAWKSYRPSEWRFNTETKSYLTRETKGKLISIQEVHQIPHFNHDSNNTHWCIVATVVPAKAKEFSGLVAEEEVLVPVPSFIIRQCIHSVWDGEFVREITNGSCLFPFEVACLIGEYTVMPLMPNIPECTCSLEREYRMLAQ